MRVLGIDPGLGITGYGIIEASNSGIKVLEAGVVRTSLKKVIQERLSTIFTEITKIIEEYRPEVCVLEELYSHYKHPRTSILMGHARGVICLACNEKKIPVVGYAAKRVKKAIVGNGSAAKEQVQRMIQNILSLKQMPSPNDVSDALALAVAHTHICPALACRNAVVGKGGVNKRTAK